MANTDKLVTLEALGLLHEYNEETYATKTELQKSIPTKVSELENDKEYITSDEFEEISAEEVSSLFHK